MPSGYAAQGKTFSKRLHKWINKETEKAFDYDSVNKESVALMVSVFRWYPDLFADIVRDENARYQLELPQRFIMRIFARYRNTYITGVRGLTKTFCLLLEKMIEGILFPGIKIRYVAPNQKQAATLATQAFHEIEKSYSVIANSWELRNDRADMFRITTPFGSEFTMYSPRGDTTGQVCGEECGQESGEPFPIEEFIKDVYPTVRDNRMVNKKIDNICINQKHCHIGNACSKTNRAYTELRNNCLKDMLFDSNPYEGYVCDISWEAALLSNIRDINYFKDLKKSLSAENWLRECCARYTGTGDSPMLTDEVLSKSRKLKVMENKHCGDLDAIYIVSHDVAYENATRNAKCADTVLKLTRFDTITKRDKYRKQAIWVDSAPPPMTAYLQAKKLKELWWKFCIEGGNPTYLVVDARAVGKDVVDELMKPMNDGLPTLSCLNFYNREIEQPNSVRCIYPLKATRAGGTDDESSMIDYYRVEFEQGNVELLTSDIRDGIDSYKNYHSIKDDFSDGKIIIPYRKTDELCQEIQNLKIDDNGIGKKERRKSPAIQRDIHSSLKYALRMAQILEQELKKEKYRAKNDWTEVIEKFQQGSTPTVIHNSNNIRANLLSLRRR